MQRLWKLNRIRSITFVFALVVSVNALAADYKILGFHINNIGQYFSNNQASFSIRSTDKDKYVDIIEVSVDGSPFQSYGGKLNFDKEGIHSILFRASDPVKNWSPLQTFRVYVDLTPPVTTAHWDGVSYRGQNGLYVNPNSKLTLTGQDNLAGIAKTLWMSGEKGEAKPYISGGTKFSQEGEHKIQYASLDNVGNQEQWKEIRFIVDSKPPETKAHIVGFSYIQGSDFFVSNGSQILLEATDAESGVQQIEYVIGEGSPGSEAKINIYDQPIAITEDLTKFRYRSVDWVGNKEPWKMLSVHLDATPPRLAVKEIGHYVPVSGKIYARPGFVLKADVEDKESGVQDIEVSTDGNNFTKTTKTEFTFDKEGESQFVLQARDRVGNVTQSDRYIVVIDSTPPLSEIKATENLIPKENMFLSSLPNTLRITGNDVGVGLARVEVSYDGRNFSTLNAPIDLATWTEGRRTIYYRSVDRLDNKEQVKSMTVQVLTQGPKVDLFVESGNSPNVPLSALLKARKTAGDARVPAGNKESAGDQ